MSLRRYRWPALVMLVLHLQACTTWSPTPLSISEVMAGDPGAVRVTTVEGTTWTLHEPRLIGDSLTTAGILAYCPPDRPEPCTADQVNGEPVTPMPLDDVVAVELREFSTARTLGAVALTGVVVFGMLYAMACSDPDSFIC